jgi:hypothetical protein
MSDVVQIAKDRRASLTAEIGKLDEFINMAEMLLANDPHGSDDVAKVKEEALSEPEKRQAAQPNLADAVLEEMPGDALPAAGTNATDRKSAGQKPDEEVLNLRSKDSSEPSKRQGLFRQAIA